MQKLNPFKLKEVSKSLTDISIQGLIISELKQCGRQVEHAEIYRGAECAVNFVLKLKLEVAVQAAGTGAAAL